MHIAESHTYITYVYMHVSYRILYILDIVNICNVKSVLLVVYQTVRRLNGLCRCAFYIIFNFFLILFLVSFRTFCCFFVAFRLEFWGLYFKFTAVRRAILWLVSHNQHQLVDGFRISISIENADGESISCSLSMRFYMGAFWGWQMD